MDEWCDKQHRSEKKKTCEISSQRYSEMVGAGSLVVRTTRKTLFDDDYDDSERTMSTIKQSINEFLFSTHSLLASRTYSYSYM